MSANPPIRGITIQASTSPSLLIKRYLSSLPAQFSYDPDERVSAQPSHCSPSASQAHPQPPPGRYDTDHIVCSLSPPAADHPSRLRPSHPQPSAQKKRQNDLVSRDLNQSSNRERQAKGRDDRTRARLQGKEKRSHRPDEARDIDRIGDPNHIRGTRRDSAEIQDETKSSKRRQARKLRRREKAAITNPQPNPKIKRPTPPPPVSRNTKAPLSRKRGPELPEKHDGSVVGSAHSRSTNHPPPKSRKRARLFSASDIIRKYQPVNIFPNTGRLTLASNEGFLGLSKSSQPIKLPQPRNKRLSAYRHQSHEPFREPYHRTDRVEYPVTRDQSPLAGPRWGNSPMQNTQLEEYRYRPRQAPGSRISDLSYSRLPAPGLTNSTSWPTWSSDRQQSGPPLRSSEGLPRAVSPQMRLAAEGNTFREDTVDYQMGRAEIDSIVGRGAWKWRAHHPIAQAINANGYLGGVSDHEPQYDVWSHVPQQDYPIYERAQVSRQQADPIWSHTNNQHARFVRLKQQPPEQLAFPYPSSTISGVSRLVPFDSEELRTDQPFFLHKRIAVEQQPSQYKSSQGKSPFIESSSSDKGWEDDSFGREIPVQPNHHQDAGWGGSGSIVPGDGGSVFGIPPSSAPAGSRQLHDQNNHGFAQSLQAATPSSLGSVFTLSQLVAYRTPRQAQGVVQTTSSEGKDFGDSF
ncbi:hypothetical protein IAU59_005360 [Kwoniella sp. CBS 9459]